MPLASVPWTSLTRGAASPPSTELSQLSSDARTVSGSRLLRRMGAPVSDLAVIAPAPSSQGRPRDVRDLRGELVRSVCAEVERADEQRAQQHLEQRVDRSRR